MKKKHRTLKFKRSRTNRLLFIIFIIAAIVTYVIWLISQTSAETYRNEQSFIKYADNQFEMSKNFEVTGSERTDYLYGEPISYAVDYAICDYENISAFTEAKIEALKAEFAENADVEQENPQALLIKTGIKEYKKGIINLAIHEKSTIKNGREMISSGNKIHTYQFSVKTGDIMVPQQIFKEDYREYCSEYFMEYFSSEYSEEQLAEGWRAYLTPDKENFNTFTVTDSGVSFYFDEGTVLRESEGIACIGIASVLSGNIMRKKLLERYIDPSKPMVAITYDDGPGLESEDRILACLEKNNAVATFFYQGAFIPGREEKIKRAKDIGCEIGHHTWNHPVLTSLTDAELKVQFDNTNNAVYAACGSYPTVFRPSYGITNDKVNAMSGVPVIMWSVDTLDWKIRDGKKIFDRVAASGNLDGKILLMHSIHNPTADATDLLVPWLKSQGYQLVTVSELIKYKSGSDPVAGAVYR